KPLTVRPTDDYDLVPFLREKAYDFVFFSYFYMLDQYLPLVMQHQPWVTTILDSVELHWMRLQSQFEYLRDHTNYVLNVVQGKEAPGEKHARRLRDHSYYLQQVEQAELHAYRKADFVITSSREERSELARQLPAVQTLAHPYTFRTAREAATPAGRRNLLFLGYFERETNTTAAIFLKHELVPRIAADLPGSRLRIVGANPPLFLRTMRRWGPSPGFVEVAGRVPQLSREFSQARVFLAPIQFGHGMFHKVGLALSHGVPMVATARAAAAYGLVPEEHYLRAENAEEFRAQILRLYSDDALWLRLSENGRRLMERSFSSREISRFARALPSQPLRTRGKIVPPPPLGKMPSLPARASFAARSGRADVSVVVLTYNQWRHTELCLRSLALAVRHFRGKAEVILVDNASQDETVREARKIRGLRVIANGENLGFAAGNNVGVREARGRDVILLNNDTVVPPEFLERMASHARRLPRLGVLGPSTNTESYQAHWGASYQDTAGLFRWNRELHGKFRDRVDFVEKVSGFCFYLPRNTIEKVGLLDPGYGRGYFEDDDYCLRAMRAGLVNACAKDVYVHHFGSISFEGARLNRQRYLENALKLFVLKWGKTGLDYVRRIHKDQFLNKTPQLFC
ncbi:MAG: glycosyltransferase, partial [Bdellovibrionales bacterium]|nr:glycosyltransferase [Bdellovibrionales bacterium]